MTSVIGRVALPSPQFQTKPAEAGLFCKFLPPSSPKTKIRWEHIMDMPKSEAELGQPYSLATS